MRNDLTATEPVSVLGCTLPAGTDIIFLMPIAAQLTTTSASSRLTALDPKRSESSLKHGLGGRQLWKDDGWSFKPERWLTKDEDGKVMFDAKSGVLTPFGLGLKSCAGKQLAVRTHFPSSACMYLFDLSTWVSSRCLTCACTSPPSAWPSSSTRSRRSSHHGAPSLRTISAVRPWRTSTHVPGAS